MSTRYLPVWYLETRIGSEDPEHTLPGMKRVKDREGGFRTLEQTDGEHWFSLAGDRYLVPVVGRSTYSTTVQPQYDPGGGPVPAQYFGAALPGAVAGTSFRFLALPVVVDAIMRGTNFTVTIRDAQGSILSTGSLVGQLGKTGHVVRLYEFDNTVVDSTWWKGNDPPQLWIESAANTLAEQPSVLVSEQQAYKTSNFEYPTPSDTSDPEYAAFDPYGVDLQPEQPDASDTAHLGFFISTDGIERVEMSERYWLTFGLFNNMAALGLYAEYLPALSIRSRGSGGAGIVVESEAGSCGVIVKAKAPEESDQSFDTDTSTNPPCLAVLGGAGLEKIFSVDAAGRVFTKLLVEFEDVAAPPSTPASGGVLYVDGGVLKFAGSGGYGVPTLDPSGKIPTTQLPALAITEVNVVADIAARDALQVQEGDIAIVNDDGTGNPNSYIYDGSAWQEIQKPADAVRSVDGRTGDVTLADLYVLQVNYTDTNVLAKVKNVDGSGSGLDADLIDGLDSLQLVRTLTQSITVNSATTTLDFAAYDNFILTMSANTTLDFSNLASRVGASGTIVIKQDATGGWTFTLPVEAVTPNGEAPAQETSPNNLASMFYFVVDANTVLINFIGNWA